MALLLQEQYKGIDAEYWRINYFTYDDVLDKAVVHLWLYANEDARHRDLENNGLKREIITLLNVKQQSLPIPDEPVSVRDALKALLYSRIMQPVYNVQGFNINKFAEAVYV